MTRATLAVTAARRARGRSRLRAGFTLVEVMVSLGVMTVGAMAIITLQQHTIRSNVHARELETATQIAQQWVELFKQDAHQWTQVGFLDQAPSVAQVLANTIYLNGVVNNPGTYRTIPLVSLATSPAADFQGNPVLPNDPAATYCASFRPSWVWVGRTMRVDVRVWWARPQTGASIGTDFQNQCADNNGDLNPGGLHFANYHVVYMPTVIRVTPLPQ